MEVSAGIIVWKRDDDDIRFFLCSPGGPLYRDRELWCFPKGNPDECSSNTFKWEDGFTYPEIEKYAWMTLDEIMESDRIKAYDYIYEKIRREALELE